MNDTIKFPQVKFSQAYSPNGIKDDCAVYIYRDKIIFVAITADEYPNENPIEDVEGNGTIWSFCSRHSNFFKDGQEAVDETLKNPDVVQLSYFEHGASLWMVADLPKPAGVEFQWDGVRFAGMWIPDDSAIANINHLEEQENNKPEGEPRKTRREIVLKYANDIVTLYNHFCNGEIYKYTFEVYKIVHDNDDQLRVYYDDYDGLECLAEESVDGFYGYEEVEQAATDEIEATLKHLQKTPA